MRSRTLRELFIEQLRAATDSEKRLLRTLPRLARASGSRDLTVLLEGHVQKTFEQAARLDRIMESIGEAPGRITSNVMLSLLEEADDATFSEGTAQLRDNALILVARRIEHYEMATYGALSMLADQIGEHAAAQLLRQTLAEEAAVDEELAQIALGLRPEGIPALGSAVPNGSAEGEPWGRYLQEEPPSSQGA